MPRFSLVLLFLAPPASFASETASYISAPARLWDAAAPHAGEVREFVGRLRYGSVGSLLNDDLKLRIDAKRRRWRLEGYRRFDPGGKVRLADGREGLCRELSEHAAGWAADIFGSGYSVAVARANETSFFHSDAAEHYVVLLIDRRTGREYVLDPSLKRYGSGDDFDDYVIKTLPPGARLDAEKDRDLEFSRDMLLPLLKSEEAMIFIGVTPMGTSFDSRNFALSLLLQRRYRFRTRVVYTVGREKGRLFGRGDVRALESFTDPAESRKIMRRLERLVREAR